MCVAVFIQIHNDKRRTFSLLPGKGQTSGIDSRHAAVYVHDRFVGMTVHNDVHFPHPGFMFDIFIAHGNIIVVTVSKPDLIFSYFKLLFPWQVLKKIVVSYYHMHRASGPFCY